MKDDEHGATENDRLSEGFWREFFLLKPDRASLRRILDELSEADLLEMEEQTRELFARSVKTLRGTGGTDRLNALDVGHIQPVCQVDIFANTHT